MSATDPGGRLAGVPVVASLTFGSVSTAWARCDSQYPTPPPTRPAISPATSTRASAESPNRARRPPFGGAGPSSGSSSSAVSAMPTTSSSAYTGGPAIQYGDCGSRHGSTAASAFHQGEPGPGSAGVNRSPGAGANAPVPA